MDGDVWQGTGLQFYLGTCVARSEGTQRCLLCWFSNAVVSCGSMVGKKRLDASSRRFSYQRETSVAPLSVGMKGVKNNPITLGDIIAVKYHQGFF